MPLVLRGADEHNLRHLTVTIPDGVTAVTGVSGSGKSSLVFDTLYHEANRRLTELYRRGSAHERPTPARVEAIEGLLPAVAVSQNAINRNPASTVATATGLHAFLRLLFAIAGSRRCPRCGARLEQSTMDDIVPAIDGGLVLAPLVCGVRGSHRTLLDLLASGQLGDIIVDGRAFAGQTLDASEPHDVSLVVARLEEGADPSARRAAIDRALSLGANIVEHRPSGTARAGSRHRWALANLCASCAQPYSPLEPKRFHQRCPACDGNGCTRCDGLGVHPDTLQVTVGEKRFGGVLALDATRALGFFVAADVPPHANHLCTEITKRLRALVDLGLGYLGLDRPSPSLSRGESQRLRLAVCLAGRLELLHVLDEPTIGLHARDTATLMASIRRLPGPVVFVEHDIDAVARADHCIDLGPGAGDDGGEITYEGPPAGLGRSKTPTGEHLRRSRSVGSDGVPTGGTASARGDDPGPPSSFLRVRGAAVNNLRTIDVSIPVGRLTAVTGVSGSGKSSLVHGVIARSLAEGRPVGCDAIAGPALACTLVDQGPIGKNPRSNPATYTKLYDTVRDLFAAATGEPPAVFSFNRPEGACPTCSGTGALEVTMRYLPSTWVECPDCHGRRFGPHALAARVPFDGRSITIADALDLTVADAPRLFETEAAELLKPAARRKAIRILETLCAIGVGYLKLGQPSPTLSGGEAQRVKLAKHLGKRSLDGELLVLDEPSTGLHPGNIADLLAGLRALIGSGTTVVVVEHNLDVIRNADWVIDLGPGAGPDGGALVHEGPLPGLLESRSSETGRALAERGSRVEDRAGSASGPSASIDDGSIVIRDARVNNLTDVTVEIPRRMLTVVTGLSGSGKSSLVRDVLEAEARRRFLETLSVYERQGISGVGDGEGATIDGLGVTVAVDPARIRYSVRSTVGSVTGIYAELAVLFAATEDRLCPVCDADMVRGAAWTCASCGASLPLLEPEEFFRSTYRAACRTCNGVGTLTSPNPDKLIVRPDLPLCGGAMHSPGFFPKGYLCKPFNGGYDELQAFASRHGFDPATTPWNEMSERTRHAFLFGEEEPLDVLFRSRTGRERVTTIRFGGFYGWIADWDTGGTYTDHVRCDECAGSGLRPEIRSVKIGGASIDELASMPLSALGGHLSRWRGANAADRAGVATVPPGQAERRIGFLERTGLGYVSLDRVEGTLSAGEAQRARLASLLGSGLTGLTVLLDEPSRGLHPNEVGSLVEVARDLCDEGNTVIVVEHERAFVEAADHVIEMGPGAGGDGGRVVYAGTPEGLARVAEAATGRVLARRARSAPATAPGGAGSRRGPTDWFTVVGARANNLDSIDVRFPKAVLTGVCGVSGSGKSTLVVDTLARVLAPVRHTTSVAYEPVEPGAHDRVENAPGRTLVVDQARGGLTTPARFLGIDDRIAKLYAASPDALDRGLSADDLKRVCTTCGGSGTIRHDMAFMPAVHSTCHSCDGTGLPDELQRVTCRSIPYARLRGMTLARMADAFGDDESIVRALEPAIDMGLGYLVAHQPGHTLSGGEAQRLKIVKQLRRPRAELYVLDEPTVGMHAEDVGRLATVLHSLVESGCSVLVVEHHPELLASCDWLVELGPGAGPNGGRVIAEGNPEALASGTTPTARHLAAALGAMW